jgi:hypothetical protein
VFLFFQKRLNEFGMVDTDVVEYQSRSSQSDIVQQVLKKPKKGFATVMFFFYTKKIACFVIKRTDQLDALVLSIGGNDLLLAFDKPCPLNRLVIMDHRFTLKKNMVDFSIQHFLHQGKSLQLFVFVVMRQDICRSRITKT